MKLFGLLILKFYCVSVVYVNSTLLWNCDHKPDENTFSLLMNNKVGRDAWQSVFQQQQTLLTGAVLQPKFNIEKLCCMAVNGLHTFPNKDIFLNRKSLYVEDDISTFSDIKLIKSWFITVSVDMKKHSSNIERGLMYNWMFCKNLADLLTATDVTSFINVFVGFHVTRKKNASVLSVSGQKHSTLHRMFHSVYKWFIKYLTEFDLSVIMSGLKTMMDNKVTDDCIPQAAKIDVSWLKLLVLMSEQMQSMSETSLKVLDDYLEEASGLFALDSSYANKISKIYDGVWHVDVFGTSKFVLDSLFDKATTVKERIIDYHQVLLDKVVNAVAANFVNDGVQKKFLTMGVKLVAKEFDDWMSRYTIKKLYVEPDDCHPTKQVGFLKYLLRHSNAMLTLKHVQYLFGEFHLILKKTSMNCTACNYSTQFKMNDFAESCLSVTWGMIGLVSVMIDYDAMLDEKIYMKCSKSRFDTLFERVMPVGDEVDSGNSKTCKWLPMPLEHVTVVWNDYISRQRVSYQVKLMHGLCLLVGGYRSELSEQQLRCVAVDKDETKRETTREYVQTRSQFSVMPTKKQACNQVEETRQHKKELKRIDLGICRKVEIYNKSRPQSMEALEKFLNSAEQTVIEDWQCMGHRLLLDNEQRDKLWDIKATLKSKQAVLSWINLHCLKVNDTSQAQVPNRKGDGNVRQVLLGFGDSSGHKMFAVGNSQMSNLGPMESGIEDNSLFDEDVDMIESKSFGNWDSLLKLKQDLKKLCKHLLDFILSNLASNKVGLVSQVETFKVSMICMELNDANSLGDQLKESHSGGNSCVIQKQLSDLIQSIQIKQNDDNFASLVVNVVYLIHLLITLPQKGQELYIQFSM